MLLPSTVDRVPARTSAEVNAEILRQTERSIAFHARAGRLAIERRLRELDEEWDIERTLEANAATASLLGLVLGAMVHKRWLLLPSAVSVFLLIHALQGWCPPLEIFRRLGVRTAAEIDYERYALKAIRGDFANLSVLASDSPVNPAHRALEAARS